MDKYVEKYPEDFRDILTLSFKFTDEVVDEICKEALSKNKRIKLVIDESKLDYLDYELI